LGNGALAAKMYKDNAWPPDIYVIDGTSGNVPAGSSFATTAITDTNGKSTVLLAYIAVSGFVNIQTRNTTDVPLSALGSFSPRVEVVETNG